VVYLDAVVAIGIPQKLFQPRPVEQLVNKKLARVVLCDTDTLQYNQPCRTQNFAAPDEPFQ
jgi:hypothetical protein